MFYPAMSGHARFTVTGQAAGSADGAVLQSHCDTWAAITGHGRLLPAINPPLRAVMGVMDGTLAAAGHPRFHSPAPPQTTSLTSRRPVRRRRRQMEGARRPPSQSHPTPPHPAADIQQYRAAVPPTAAAAAAQAAHRPSRRCSPPRAAVLMRTQVYESALASDGRPNL